MNINHDELIDVLTDLAQLDIDAVEAYAQALKHIDDPIIHGTIYEFQQDHERHIEALSNEILKLNGNPPKRTKDFTGFMIKGFTALKSIFGMKGALEAMQSNEKLTNKNYNEALDKPLPEHIKLLIQKNYDDEKKHLTYITETLKRIK